MRSGKWNEDKSGDVFWHSLESARDGTWLSVEWNRKKVIC